MKTIVESAADPSVTTEEVVRALYIAAVRGNSIEKVQNKLAKAVEWTGRELQSYGANEELPSYRRWKVTVSARTESVVIGQRQEDGTPWKNERKAITITQPTLEAARIELAHECRMSIGAIENELGRSSQEGVVRNEDPALTEALNNFGVEGKPRGWRFIEGTKDFPVTNMVDVVNRVRHLVVMTALEAEKGGVILVMPTGGQGAETAAGRKWTSWLPAGEKIEDAAVLASAGVKLAGEIAKYFVGLPQ